MAKHVFLAAAIALGFTVLEAAAATQEWPSRPVTIVVPQAAGSGGDILTRILAPFLSERLGQQVIVENIGGAGGMTGVSRVAGATADGYRIVFGHAGTHAISQTIRKKPPYNAVTDFTPVALISIVPFVVIARKDLPASNLQEFARYAKANQAQMRFGSGGTGSGVHLACVLLNAAIGIDISHIPYRGGGLAMQDLMAGRIDYQCEPPSVARAPLEAGSVKALAILTKHRLSTLPNLASAHEQGLTGFEATGWNAFFAPRGVPAPIIRKLNAAIVETIELPPARERLTKLGYDIVPPARRTPEYLQEFVVNEIKKWAAAIKAANIPAK